MVCHCFEGPSWPSLNTLVKDQGLLSGEYSRTNGARRRRSCTHATVGRMITARARQGFEGFPLSRPFEMFRLSIGVVASHCYNANAQHEVPEYA